VISLAPRSTPKAAPKPPSNGKPAPLTVTSVTPPPRTGRKGTVAFPEADVAALATAISDGSWHSDGQTYESKQTAQTRITRLKRALIHFGHYKEPGQIKTRVYTDGSKFRLALTDKAAASKPKASAKA
jgi:hypothetical protein